MSFLQSQLRPATTAITGALLQRRTATRALIDGDLFFRVLFRHSIVKFITAGRAKLCGKRAQLLALRAQFFFAQGKNLLVQLIRLSKLTANSCR